MAKLPVSNLVNVQINLASAPAQIQNLSNVLILGSSDVIDMTERRRVYSTLTSVASDFGSSAPEYLAAAAWFSQQPQPTQCLIGQWAKTAVAGRLIGAPVTLANQQLSAWTGITTGAFNIAIDGAAASDITACDFSSVTSMDGVAAVIDTKLAGATCTWDYPNQRFVIKSITTGVTSAISFMADAATGVDITLMLGMRASSSGAYAVPGYAAEDAIDAVIDFDDKFGQKWYSAFICGADNDDHLAVAAFIEGSNNKHAYGINSQEGAILTSNDTTSIAYQMKELGYRKTLTQYSSTSLYAVVSLMARIMTTDYTANNTVITLMYKGEPGINAESLSETQMTNLLAKNCNVFVEYDNETAIIQPGVCASSDFIDIIFSADWLALTIQNSLYNLLYSTSTKIPQTDEGSHVLATGIAQVCAQAVNNGMLAPGVWTQGGFGTLKQNDYLSDGFYVYAPPVATQNPADRAARKSVPFQVAAKLAGAVHTVNCILYINR